MKLEIIMDSQRLTTNDNPRPSIIKRIRFACKKKFESDVILGRGTLFNADWHQLLRNHRKSHHFVVTDETVSYLYGGKLLSFLRKEGVNADICTVPAGEESKSIEAYARLSANILKNGVDGSSCIVGLGGGVVNNIAGFLASTIYRGIGLIQIPTSLLSQVDAAIDFKQAINGPSGKNHIGSYYPANIVVVDPDLLKTLPMRQLQNGLAETIKHAITEDGDFFDYLLSYRNNSFENEFLDRIVAHTIKLKVALFHESANPEYSEMVRQYGHAVGHALEQISQYKILHGEAIAIGMCITAETALMLNICNEETTSRHYEIMARYKLPINVPSTISDTEILRALRHDKYFLNNRTISALVPKIGSVRIDKTGSCAFAISDAVLVAAIKNNRARKVVRL